MGMCRCWGDDVAEDAKAKAEEAKQYASDAVDYAKEKTEPWADWAKNKFSEYCPLLSHSLSVSIHMHLISINLNYVNLFHS